MNDTTEQKKRLFLVMGSVRVAGGGSHYDYTDETRRLLYHVWAISEDEAVKMVEAENQVGNHYIYNAEFNLTVAETLGTPD